MTAYYNEIDPFAANWLRNLIAGGHIAPGDVDERSIKDVKPDDLRGYTQCHFFAGIGGWSHALRLAGWDDARPVWTGSCPCQPFSTAGKQKGHDDARHLWPDWFRLIRECRPSAIFGEQVASAIGHGWLDLVFDDLEAQCYACGAVVLPACSVGAPHIRQRLWFMADSTRNGWREERADAGGQPAGDCAEGRPAGLESGRGAGELADSASGRRAFEQHPGSGYAADGGREGNRQSSGCAGELADSQCAGLEGYAGHGDDGHQPGRLGAHAAGSVTESRGAGFWSDLDWLPCIDGKARPTKPGLFPLANGVSARVGKLRAAGNAIVPQVAAAFIVSATRE